MEQRDRPHILLITTDQQRFDTVGPRSPDFLRTPHLDQLGREGVRFDRAYAECPICVPSRVSIMTGRSVLSHGMAGNGSTSEVMGRDGTLPSVLRDLGYSTAAIGKMHFTPERARHGFDEMLLPADYYRWMSESGTPVQPMRHGLGQNELYPGMATVPEALTLTTWIADQCVRYVRDRRDPTTPFFLWASFTKPHPPLDPPEPYASMYRDAPVPDPVYGDWSGDDAAPEAFLRQRQRHSYDLVPPSVIRAAREAYYGLITHVDYAIGRIFAGLQDVGLLDDTFVVFTSDHGEFLGDHHAGNKVMFHEPSAHVPFLVRPPKRDGHGLHGTTSDALVTHADVLPTLVAAAGGVPSPDLDGHDLLATVRGGTPVRQYVCGLAADGRSGAGAAPAPVYLAVTDGRWKYIWYPEGAQEQLFDLDTDPDELVDRSGRPDTEEVRRALSTALAEQLRKAGSPWATIEGLVETPLRQEPVTDRRATAWPGYHTESYGVDVRH
ncbi:sulfatase-like hydrolase/transferase [Actinopolymorpha sp. B17G11]|uniref:sulfatase-like hydrolase/transferase n=1 Tax=Actinopolymorpha sp. B17G11 TaxID=3160861 RepID=UPI0032E43D60